MKVLIGCEESQVVCKAFRDRGHEAYSCDLEPTRGNPDWHFQQDVKALLITTWFDLIILHPDCTAMALSGNRWYGRGMPKHQERIDAIVWTTHLWNLAKKAAPLVCLENPTSVIFNYLYPQKLPAMKLQYIQPWMFGHLENKKTGLALHGLPELVPTNDVSELMKSMSKAEANRIHHMPPGPNRKRDRSVTYQGIADAMADQWGIL